MSSDAKTAGMAKLEEISAKLDALTAAVAALGKAPRAAASSGGGAVFPGYGNSKGMPIAGADLRTLEFYANGCRKSLGDPAKARWHDKEKALLATIEAEIAAQGGGAPGGFNEPPPHTDADSIPF